jgi:hypothetical protein
MAGREVSRQPEPKNVEELLWLCGSEIAAGRVNRAEALAKRFVASIDSSRHVDLRERYKRYAYAWYVLSNSAYRVCLQCESSDIAPRLIDFFTAYKSATWYFLQYARTFHRRDPVSARDSRFRDDLDTLHRRVYETWDKGTAMRADLAANSRIAV